MPLEPIAALTLNAADLSADHLRHATMAVIICRMPDGKLAHCTIGFYLDGTGMPHARIEDHNGLNGDGLTIKRKLTLRG